MKRYQFLALGLAASLAWSCSSSTPKAEAIRDAATEPAALLAPLPPSAAPLADEPTAVVAADATPPAAPLPAPTAPVGRLLIYHAEVRLKTEAMPRAAARLDSLVRRSGGYLSAATETRADGEWRQQSTIRVPPARFQALLGGLSGLGTVEEKKLSTDDVTAAHADVAARLQAKRAVERQYAALLSRARTIREILEVQARLAETREDIEATESRLKTLNDEVGYATIALTLYQPLPQPVPDAPVVSLGSRLVEAIYTGWSLLLGLVLGAITIWPLWVLGAAGGWLWLRRTRRRAVRPNAG